MGINIGNINASALYLGSTEITKVYQGVAEIYLAGGAVDPDAQAFITAAEITNETEQTAINTLVVSLKADGLWDKMQILYPFVGGTALSNKFNLKNPLDTDAAYRLSLIGTFTFSNLGIQIGAQSYGIPNWIPSQESFTNGVHMSAFINQHSTNNDGYQFGSAGGGGGDWALINRFFDNKDYWNAGSGGYLTATSTTRIGFSAGSTAPAGFVDAGRKLYENNNLTGSDGTTAIGTGTNIPIFFAAVNNNGLPQNIDVNARYTFASIGQHLTQAEMLTFFNTLTAFNTTLAR